MGDQLKESMHGTKERFAEIKLLRKQIGEYELMEQEWESQADSYKTKVRDLEKQVYNALKSLH